MNNIDHLIHQDFINQMPGSFVAHDKESRFIASNKSGVEWLGFKSNEEMIGKTYYDMPCRASEMHEEFRNQDQIILKNGGYGKIIGLYCYSNNNWKLIFAEKYPIKNNEGEIIAICSYLNDFTHANVIDISRFLNISLERDKKTFVKKQTGYLIQDYHADAGLTPRQSVCLFFLLRGKSAKEIASLLSISSRTVEIHINDIKNKMCCETKSQLIEKAIHLGYMNIIPEGLIKI